MVSNFDDAATRHPSTEDRDHNVQLPITVTAVTDHSQVTTKDTTQGEHDKDSVCPDYDEVPNTLDYFFIGSSVFACPKAEPYPV